MTIPTSLSTPLEQMFPGLSGTSVAPDPTLPALSLHLPQYQATLAHQLSSGPVAAALAQYPDVAPAYQALMDRRVNLQGVAPWSGQTAVNAIQAAGTNTPTTPPPDTSFWQNITNDVGTIASSIPKIPVGLFKEATDLPNVPGEIAGAFAKATSPTEALGNLAHVTGLNLIPGSYNVGNLATGGPGLLAGIAEHPVMAGLDILPYVSEAADATKTVTMAEDTAKAQASIAADAGLDPNLISLRTPPIRTFLRYWHPDGIQVDPEGIRLGMNDEGPVTAPAMTPNAFGQAVDNIKSVLGSTTAGRKFLDTFGSTARQVARAENRFSAGIVAAPETFDEGSIAAAMASARDTADQIMVDHGVDLTPSQRAEVSVALQSGDPSVVDALAPDQKKYAAAVQSLSETMGQAKVQSGDLVGLPYAHGTELYPAKLGNGLLDRRAAATTAVNQIADFYKGNEVPGLEPSYTMEADGKPPVETDPHIAQSITRLQNAAQTYNWQGVYDELGFLRDNAKFDPLPYSLARQQLRSLIRAEADAIPARFTELANQSLQDSMIAGIKDGSISNPDLNPELMMQAASARAYGRLGLSPDEIRAAAKDAYRTWQDMAARGLDPTFIPAVGPDQVSQLYSPSVADHPPSIDSLKSRTLDAQGTTQDPAVALKYDAVQYLRQHQSRLWTDWLTGNYARTGAELQDLYLPAVDAMRASNPLLDDKAILQSLINDEYRPFNPDDPFGTTRSPSSIDPAAQLYLPRDVSSVLNQYARSSEGLFNRLMPGVMRTFRMAIMPFHPQFYVHQTFGNSLMYLLDADNPLMAYKYLRDAYNIAKNPDQAAFELSSRPGETLTRNDIAGLPPQIHNMQQAREYVRDLDVTRPGAAARVLGDFKGGQKLRELMDQASPANNALDATRGVVQSLAQKGFNFASIAHNMATTMAYLEGFDNALTAGMTREEAIRAGVDSGRQFMETWDALTPTERTMVRSIMPFYGYTRNLLKYTLQYPSTHPWRMSILTNLAKTEAEDANTALPEQLQSLLYFGAPDADGNQRAISLSGLNPFRDVASYASLLGFATGGQGDLSAITKNLNPLLSTALEELGVDPTRGQGQLHPDLYYDPTTGRLGVKTGNPLTDFANAIVPQTTLLSDLMGQNQEFKAVLNTNPDAAGRMLLSSFGVPVLARNVNVPQEAMKSEATRYQQQQSDLSSALRSGDLSGAQQWPGLQQFLANLAAHPDQLKQLQLAQSGNTIPSAVAGGLLGSS